MKNPNTSLCSLLELERALFASGKLRTCPGSLEYPASKDTVIVQPYFITKAVLEGGVEKKAWDFFSTPKDQRSFHIYLKKNIKSQKRRIRVLKKLIDLAQKRLLVNASITEEQLLSAAQKSSSGSKSFYRLVIVPTLRCNFKCSYCFTHGNLCKGGDADLSWGHLKDTVDFFFNDIKPDIIPSIPFYGGEPLLRSEFIKKAVNYIRKIEQKRLCQTESSHIYIITNGSLIDDGIARWMADNNIAATVSLDGPELHNDGYRRYASGRGTHGDILRGIELLDKYNIGTTISVTIGRHNLDSVAKDIKWIVRNIGYDLTFNFMQDFISKDNPYAMSEGDYDLLTKRLSEIYDYLDAKGVTESIHETMLERFLNGETRFRHCSACGGQMVVEPGGLIRTCILLTGSKSDALNVDRISSFFKSNLWKKWNSRDSFALNMTDKKCPLRLICGGGCPLTSVIEGKSFNDCSSIACHLGPFFLKRCVKIYYERYLADSHA